MAVALIDFIDFYNGTPGAHELAGENILEWTNNSFPIRWAEEAEDGGAEGGRQAKRLFVVAGATAGEDPDPCVGRAAHTARRSPSSMEVLLSSTTASSPSVLLQRPYRWGRRAVARDGRAGDEDIL